MEAEVDLFWVGGAVGTALMGMLLITPIVIRVAHRMGWVALPRSDRWHDEPTALMGGIAIFAAFITAVLIALPQYPGWILAGGVVMFATGVGDDIWDISPAAKVLAQVVAASLLLLEGYTLLPGLPGWASVPLTFVWIIGVTNSFNLIDGMDGLAAGLALIASICFGGMALQLGVTGTAGVAGVLAGAAGGFLVFNFKPARIFMGDGGSLFIGYMLAAIAISVQPVTSESTQLTSLLVPTAVLAVPIFDTLLVTASRTLSGREITRGGNDHTMHRLARFGLSERATVLFLYGIGAVFGGTALSYFWIDAHLFYALLGVNAVLLGALGVYLGRVNVYKIDHISPTSPKPKVAPRLRRLLFALFGQRWKAVFGILADLMLIIASFVLANYLHVGQQVTTESFLFGVALPIVVAIKLAVFYGMGLYRGLWHHAGTPEVLRLAQSTILASVAALVALVLVFGLGDLSLAVFVIDWMITTIAVGGVRFGFRGLRQYLASQRTSGQRVLLYGAGDAGLLALRELRQNPDRNWRPVGFIDDDPLKQDQRVQGVKVLGSGSDLAHICDVHNIHTVLITAVRMTEARRMAICSACHEAGVPCRIFRLSFEPAEEEVAYSFLAEHEVPSGDGM